MLFLNVGKNRERSAININPVMAAADLKVTILYMNMGGYLPRKGE